MGDAARLLLASARERFSVAATDLLLPERSRLTEWQRLTASNLLSALVRSVEDALREKLAIALKAHQALHAALTSERVAIALPLLERAQALNDPDLGIVLVRRVEEHRFWKDAGAGKADRLMSALLTDDDAAIAEEAMALLVARSRRFDRFQEPLMGETDLPAELHHRLVWMVAAALRQYMVQHHSLAASEADAAIGEAAAAMVAAHDEGASLEACCTRLAQKLRRAGRLEGPDLADMLGQGMLPLFLAGIATRCGLDYGAAWELLADPQGRGAAMLLRAAHLNRADAAAIFLTLNTQGRMFSGQDGDAAAVQLALFDDSSEAEAHEMLRLWRIDPGYRAAIARLSTRSRAGASAA